MRTSSQPGCASGDISTQTYRAFSFHARVGGYSQRALHGQSAARRAGSTDGSRVELVVVFSPSAGRAVMAAAAAAAAARGAGRGASNYVYVGQLAGGPGQGAGADV